MGLSGNAPAAFQKVICLTGGRPGLAEACREALSEELQDSGWTLIQEPTAVDLHESDLVIWDVQPGSPAPEPHALSGDCEHVFIVHESRLAEVCRSLPIAAAARILVEPSGSGDAREFLLRIFRRSASPAPDPRKGDRDDLLQGLLLAGLRLSEFQRERGDFFRRALRDLTGPLTAVGGYCGLLLDQRLGPLTEAQLDVLRQMQGGVERLSDLLASMLQLSQGVMEPSRIQLGTSDITVVLDRAVALALGWAEAREVDIRLDVVPPSEVLRFDSRLIHEVFACLLNVACRFTPFGGAVDVRGYPVRFPEPGGDGYRVDVRDFGQPIPPECVKDVFGLSSVCAHGFDRSGGGLELAMCKMIVDAHGGEISVASGDGGTVFSVVLPSGLAAEVR